jgi:hypothetical protein
MICFHESDSVTSKILGFGGEKRKESYISFLHLEHLH